MQLLNKFQRLYHTVRPLRFEQIAYRIFYKLFPLKNLPDGSTSVNVSDWVWQGPEVVESSFLGGNQVCFLNLSGQVQSSQDWNSPAFEKLWLYNLHYFDDLNARDSKQRTAIQLALVERWIAENPAVSGNGWEPYPLSLRLVNWIKWYNRVKPNKPEIVRSIDLQAKALSKQLEYHILGNHLFANAKALVFVGCFLQGDSAAKYLELGLKILQREIPEQFLTDGGHFELSPMYHCILLWDLLDLINLAEITGRHELVAKLPQWRSVALKALSWLRVMQHPDGEVSFFNDSAIGIAATPEQLFNYAQSLKLGLENLPLPELVTLPVSGYSRVSMPEHTLLFDHAAVGPDYLPGHAHADNLSIEWSVGKDRVLVNSGTSVYGISTERLRQRQTAAHNTIVVDNTDSSEVWGGFRVAQRAYCRLLHAEYTNRNVYLTAEHDGFKRLRGKVMHKRSIIVSVDALKVEDSLTGSWNEAKAFWHLHPDIKCTRLTDSSLVLLLPNLRKVIIEASAPITLEDTSWHPGFGVSVPTQKLVIVFKHQKLNTQFRLL